MSDEQPRGSGTFASGGTSEAATPRATASGSAASGTAAASLTLADVARRAGVATSTASLVFSGRGPVAPATARRVLDAAAALGYAGPDPRAAQLRTGRTRVVGVSYDGTLASAFADPYHVALLGGFSSALDESGYGLLLLPETGDADTRPALAAHGMDAVLFAMCDTDLGPDLDALAARGLPLLGTGAPLDGRVVQLRIPDRAATADIVRHLHGLGHTRIGHVMMPLAAGSPHGRASADPSAGRVDAGADERAGADPFPQRVSAAAAAAVDYVDTRDRALGFLDAGGSPDLIAAATDLTVEAGAAAASLLLDADAPPTALVCQSDLLALGAIRAAGERRLRVPDDLSVAGFDGIETPWFDGILTTADQSPAEKGRELGRMMQALLRGERVASATFAVRLRVGTTTGPVPAT